MIVKSAFESSKNSGVSSTTIKSPIAPYIEQTNLKDKIKQPTITLTKIKLKNIDTFNELQKQRQEKRILHIKYKNEQKSNEQIDTQLKMVTSQSVFLKNRMGKKIHDYKIEKFFNSKKQQCDQFKHQMDLFAKYNH